MLVSKDHGGGFVAAELARVAKGHGEEVLPVTEGFASAYFWQRGIPVIFQGSVNFNNLPFWVDSQKMVRNLAPDVIVVTLGAPINLEQQFATVANALKIPLVFLTDCAGAEVRTDAKAELILTVDEVGADVANLHLPGVPVEIVGHPGVPDAATVAQIRDRSLEEYHQQDIRTYAYVGGDPGCTTEQLGLLVECLGRTRGDWRLFYRFHPKYAKERSVNSEFTWGELWEKMLGPLDGRAKPDPVGDAKLLVGSADVTIADWSTLLYTAAACGKTPVFLETPKVLTGMRGETGMSTFPLVQLGAAHRVADVIDLSQLKPLCAAGSLQPYDPAMAYRAISEHIFSQV